MDLQAIRDKILAKLEKVTGRSRDTFPNDVIRRTLLVLLARGYNNKLIAQEFDIAFVDSVDTLMLSEFRTPVPLAGQLLNRVVASDDRSLMKQLPPPPATVVVESVRYQRYDNDDAPQEQEGTFEPVPIQQRAPRSITSAPARKLLPAGGEVCYTNFKERLAAQSKILPEPFFGLTPAQKEEARDIIPDVYGNGRSEEIVARNRGVTISEVITEMRVLWLPPSNLWKQHVVKLLQKRRSLRLFDAAELGLIMSYLFAIECSQLELEECAHRFGCIDRQTPLDIARSIDRLLLEAYKRNPKDKRCSRPTPISAVDQFLDEAASFGLVWKRDEQALPRPVLLK